MRYKYTDEDIVFLKNNYPIGNWDEIFKRFPNLTKSCIHKKCHRLGIKFDMTYKSINTDFKNRKRWTNDELRILKENYSHIPIENMLLLLPNRSIDSIRQCARKNGLSSYTRLNSLWSTFELDYIRNNWISVPDKIMAEHLGRTFRSVKAKREELGFFRQNIDDYSYPTLSKFLRGQNQEWKKESMKSCNYKCVLTGSKNFEIHHLYGVSNIINDILNKHVEYKDKDFSDYTDEDLSFILQLFIEEQSKYPLGECVDKKIHVLFHSMYGQYYNTPEQWYKFKKDYLNGIYKEYA